MQQDLKNLYKEKIVPALVQEFEYQNISQVPKVVKISVNRGLGEASKNSKELDSCVKEIATITGPSKHDNYRHSSLQGIKRALESLFLFT
jgi:large subunit ribosomal protein L5